MSLFSSGRIWPYFIGGSIVLVFGFCVATIVVTQGVNIQESDAYMSKYQDADANANEIIQATISFDKKYKIEYVEGSALTNSVSYKITDINAKSLDNAKVIISTSRPETKEFDQKLDNPQIKDGIYTFSDLKFPKEGVWNIIAKVEIGDDYKYYHIKADTRNAISYEY